MKLELSTAVLLLSAAIAGRASAQGNEMVKMCLFYEHPTGHARSDPIINGQCASSHVHTFYGPREFHPDTTYDDLLATPPDMNTSPYVENGSLYWHPSFYRVLEDGVTHVRVSDLESSPYYRWDKSVSPLVEPFPPRFRMIASSADVGADGCGGTIADPTGAGNCGEDSFHAMFTECCDFRNNGESCTSYEGGLVFPTGTCDFLGIALGK